MSSNKIDYAKKGWRFVYCGMAIYIIFIVVGIFSQLVSDDIVFPIVFDKIFFISILILSLISAYFFLLASFKQKFHYILMVIFLLIIIFYSAWGTFESFLPYPFD